jgi:hypothetical protein
MANDLRAFTIFYLTIILVPFAIPVVHGATRHRQLNPERYQGNAPTEHAAAIRERGMAAALELSSDDHAR